MTIYLINQDGDTVAFNRDKPEQHIVSAEFPPLVVRTFVSKFMTPDTPSSQQPYDVVDLRGTFKAA